MWKIIQENGVGWKCNFSFSHPLAFFSPFSLCFVFMCFFRLFSFNLFLFIFFVHFFVCFSDFSNLPTFNQKFSLELNVVFISLYCSLRLLQWKMVWLFKEIQMKKTQAKQKRWAELYKFFFRNTFLKQIFRAPVILLILKLWPHM